MSKNEREPKPFFEFRCPECKEIKHKSAAQTIYKRKGFFCSRWASASQEKGLICNNCSYQKTVEMNEDRGD